MWEAIFVAVLLLMFTYITRLRLQQANLEANLRKKDEEIQSLREKLASPGIPTKPPTNKVWWRQFQVNNGEFWDTRRKLVEEVCDPEN